MVGRRHKLGEQTLVRGFEAMASGDIRKWFMKQPAKSTPAATPASNVSTSLNFCLGNVQSPTIL